MAFPIVPVIIGLSTILPSIIELFHKDDPNKPTQDPAQAIPMIMQQMMPFLIMGMMDKGDDKSDFNPLMLMFMMQGFTGTSATGSMTDAATKMAAMQAQMNEMMKLLESLKQ
jgi:hypothetical protein